MANKLVAPGLQTSPIFRVMGQRSRWSYPNQRATPEHCEVLRDINLSESGRAEVRSGYSLYNQTALPSAEAVIGLTQNTDRKSTRLNSSH